MSFRDRLHVLKSTIEKKVESIQLGQLSNLAPNLDVSTQSELLETQKDCMRGITRAIRKQGKSVEGLLESKNSLESVFDEFAKSCYGHPSLKESQLESTLREAALFERSICEQFKKMEEKVERILVTTFDNYVEESLKPSYLMKKKYEKDIRDYDAAITRAKNAKASKKPNPAKQQEADTEMASLGKVYEATEKEAVELLKQANQKSEAVVISKLCEYWDIYNNFFQEGVKLFQAYAPKIEKFKKYCHTMQRAKAEEAKTKIFGVSLAEVVRRDSRRVPKIIVACTQFIQTNLRDVQGIFRVSAVKDELDDLKSKFDRGIIPEFTLNDNPHAISGILKQYLREMPDPCIPFTYYQDFLKVNKMATGEQPAELKRLIDILPEPNKKTLHHIVRMCVLIDEMNAENKMTSSNLATVLCPNMLYSKTPDPLNMVQEMEVANSVFTRIIQNAAVIFETDDLEVDNYVVDREVPADGAESGTEGKSETPRRKRKTNKKNLTAPTTKSPRPKKSPRAVVVDAGAAADSGKNSSADDASETEALPTDSSAIDTSALDDVLEDIMVRDREERDKAKESGAPPPTTTPPPPAVATPPVSKPSTPKPTEDGIPTTVEPLTRPESPSKSSEPSPPALVQQTPSNDLLSTTDNAPPTANLTSSTSVSELEESSQDDELALPAIMDEVHIITEQLSLNPLSRSVCLLVHAAYSSYFAQQELDELNACLRDVAQQTKYLVVKLRDVDDYFSESIEEIDVRTGDLQTQLRAIIVATKDMHNDPNALESRDKLLSAIQHYANALMDLWHLLYGSSLGHVDVAISSLIQETAGTLATILRGAISKTLADDFSTIEATMREQIANVVRLTDLRGCLLPGFTSKHLDDSVDAMVGVVGSFLNASGKAASDPDNDEHTTEIRTEAKNLVVSFRTVESSIQEDIVVESDINVLRKELSTSLKHISDWETSTKGSSPLAQAAHEDIRILVEQSKNWTEAQDYFSPPDMVSSLIAMSNAVLHLLSLVQKHRIGLSEESEHLIAFANAIVIQIIRSNLLVSINALEQNEMIHLELLITLIRTVNTVAVLLF